MRPDRNMSGVDTSNLLEQAIVALWLLLATFDLAGFTGETSRSRLFVGFSRQVRGKCACWTSTILGHG